MLKDRNRKVAIYMASVVAFALGVTYAAVPLYKVFCQVLTAGIVLYAISRVYHGLNLFRTILQPPIR